MIATGDLLHAVDNVSVYGKTADEVFKKKNIVGKEGTTVNHNGKDVR